MKTRISFVVLAAALVPWIASGADKPKPAPAAKPPATLPPVGPMAGDVQDFVFLSDTRPVLVRLHLQIDARSYQAAWDDYFMKKFFDYFDVNGDGVLSQAEVEKAPRPNILRNLAQGAIGFRGQENTIKIADIGPAKPGQVTRQEFAAYYRKNNFGPVQVSFGPDKGTSDKLLDALFEHLDTNKDGKLSKEEVMAAPEVLHSLDIDEDEIITANELLPNLNSTMRFGFRGATPGGDMRGFDASGFLLLGVGEPQQTIVSQILARYDKDKNNKLSRTEIGLEPATFDKLDANKDGQLDATELAQWLAGPPDLEIIVRLGEYAPKEAKPSIFGGIAGQLTKSLVPALDMIGPSDKNSAMAKAVKKESSGAMMITLGMAQIELQRTDNNNVRFGGNKQFYLQQFKAAAGKKMYLEKKEAMQSPYFQGIFDMADRDGDGKLYEKELVTFLDLQTQAGASFTTLTLTDYGRGLFELFDTNGDGRLSPRELKTAWTRLAALDKDKRGYITRDDIPRKFQLMVSQGITFFGSRFGNNLRGTTPGIFSGKPGGPAWFRKMDRNGDGDVSRREFLGSEDDFKRIDTDNDGLIDLKEAEAADSWFKKKLEKPTKQP
jgi:Ca2+-binding EF-hand superfamily protein